MSAQLQPRQLSAMQRQIDAQSPDESADPEVAAYEAWCEARSHCDEVDAMRDFMLQHKRARGVLTGTFDSGPLRMATVAVDTFADWTAWDMRVNWKRGVRS